MEKFNSASMASANICVYAEKKIYQVPIEYAYDGYFIYQYKENKLREKLPFTDNNKLYEIDLLEILFDWQCVFSLFEFVEMNDTESFVNAAVIEK